MSVRAWHLPRRHADRRADAAAYIPSRDGRRRHRRGRRGSHPELRKRRTEAVLGCAGDCLITASTVPCRLPTLRVPEAAAAAALP
eukprot:362322-Chlamydomonas_euryale.AAC.15